MVRQVWTRFIPIHDFVSDLTQKPLVDAFPTKSVGYFPGYSLPDFSPSKTSGRFQASGYPGHVSVVTSPFLANSKVPSVPHLLESDTNAQINKDGAARKRVVINIINGGNTNTSFFDALNRSKSKVAKNTGLVGIQSPINSMNDLLSRNRRSLIINVTSSKYPNILAIEGNQNTTVLQRSGIPDDDFVFNYSPPENNPNLFNLNNFDYDYYTDNSDSSIKQEVLNPDPVDPSNLLIGFGGVRSTTRIPFINKLKNDNTMQQYDYEKYVPKATGLNNEDNKFFGDFSNLIQLNKEILDSKRPYQPSAISTNIQNQNAENLNKITGNGKPQPGIQMIFRPGGSQNTVRQNNFQLPKKTLPNPSPEFSDYTQFDYEDYFGSDTVDGTVGTASTSPNKQKGTNTYPNRFVNQPINQYPTFQQNAQYPYAPGYPYPYYPPYPALSPASSSTSVSCTSGGCAAAASAAAGSSSSSSTSTSTRGTGAGSGGSSASSSSGYGGASSSSSGRSSLVPIEAEEEFEVWNSFEPISKETFFEHLEKDFIKKVENSKILPVPGIIQPLLERKKRAAQQSSSANLISRLTDFMNDDLDKLQEDLEVSPDPMVVHMNHRVDTIMDSVHNAMDHPEMGEFMKMMLATPIAAILMNLFGLPIETTALLGIIVPMFLMQRISHSENQSQDQ